MRYFNKKVIVKYIQMYSDFIDTAYIGIKEDWSSTFDIIYENNRFIDDINNIKCGVDKTSFGTPILLLHMKDKSILWKDVYYGNRELTKSSLKIKELLKQNGCELTLNTKQKITKKIKGE